MAEFCLDCFNRLFNTNHRPGQVTLDYDLCEGCGQWKMCVVSIPYSGQPSENVRLRPKKPLICIQRKKKKRPT